MVEFSRLYYGKRRMSDEENTLQSKPNHQGIKRGVRWPHRQSSLPRIRYCRSDVLQLEE